VGNPREVSIFTKPGDPIAAAPSSRWATDHLTKALSARGIGTRNCANLQDAPPDQLCILTSAAAGLSLPDGPEVVCIAPQRIGSRQVLLAGGSDPRGLTYALTGLADAVTNSADPLTALHPSQMVVERPANQIRSVMRLFASDIEDKSWFNDREFWKSYLTMLVTERFNRFNLALGLGYDFARDMLDTYFYFAYPFLLKVPGYDVKATGLADAERDRNLEMLRFISDECAARGLHFQLGLWTHAYKWANSPKVNYNIEGLTDDKHASYCREALALLLKECPNISGITFRIHGESGVAEGSYDFWKAIFDGVVRSGRKLEIDMHAKGMDQGMIDVALATGLPVNISPKFWAEHMGLPYHQAWIRPNEIPRGRATGLMALSTGERSFTRYGWADLLKEDRKYGILHRIWPGTQRVLLWGDPAFAAAYGRASSFCGSLGCEIMEPMSFKGRKGSGLPGSRTAYADKSLIPSGGDFEKYRYSYRLWGRLLYNPDTDPEVWRRMLRKDYGSNASEVEASLASASRILPLVTTAHCPSAANNNYWPEVYVNHSMFESSRTEPYGDTPSPKRFGTVSPLDPQLFSRVDDCADELIKGDVSGKYSPIEVAKWLEDLAAGVKPIQAADTASRRLAIDLSVMASLGRFFAHKLRAGVLWAVYEKSGQPESAKRALSEYRAAREEWSRVVEITKGIYAADITYGIGWFQRGHWQDRLDAIDKDIAMMEQRTTREPTTAPEAALRVSIEAPSRPSLSLTHTAPPSFRRGEPMTIELASAPTSTTLYYRHVNQAEPWQSMAMQVDANVARATIPGEYTQSPYPLQYYFELRDADGRAALYPGLGPSLTDQPYFLVRQNSAARA
jgi:hypothetical protein